MKDSAPPSAMPDTWYQVRKKVGDIRPTLPAGHRGPFFNDEFGDTFGNIYALTGDGFSYAQLKESADRIRNELLRVKDVAKVDLFGEQDEKIYVELSNAKLATFGIEPGRSSSRSPARTPSLRRALRDARPTRSTSARAATSIRSRRSARRRIRANGRLFRLGDIARVERGFADPPQPKMRFLGREALGIGVSMVPRGDIIALGANLDREVARIERELPVGSSSTQVTTSPPPVKRSVNEFVRSLAEAVLIVLAVSLLSLGLRTGLIVALSIPLMLAAPSCCMQVFGIDLHKISLGALIIALGLLVDDAIISVEMMATKMEQGWARVRAASFAYTTTAMPMLSGTLVTAAGFLPIAPAASTTGEYTLSIFPVTTIALLASWVAAVVFVPLPRLQAASRPAQGQHVPSRLRRLLARSPRHGHRASPPGSRRRHSAAGRTARSRACVLPHGLLSRPAAGRALVRRAPQDRDRCDRRPCSRSRCSLPLCAAAVLPGRQPAGADRRPAAAAGRLVRRDRGAGQALRASARRVRRAS